MGRDKLLLKLAEVRAEFRKVEIALAKLEIEAFTQEYKTKISRPISAIEMFYDENRGSFVMPHLIVGFEFENGARMVFEDTFWPGEALK